MRIPDTKLNIFVREFRLSPPPPPCFSFFQNVSLCLLVDKKVHHKLGTRGVRSRYVSPRSLLTLHPLDKPSISDPEAIIWYSSSDNTPQSWGKRDIAVLKWKRAIIPHSTVSVILKSMLNFDRKKSKTSMNSGKFDWNVLFCSVLFCSSSPHQLSGLMSFTPYAIFLHSNVLYKNI